MDEEKTIRFESEEIAGRSTALAPSGGLAARLIAWGVVKDETQAKYALLGGALIAIALAFIIPSFFSSGGLTQTVSSQQLDKIRANMQPNSPNTYAP